MKSTGLFPLGTALGLAALLSVLNPTAAAAEPDLTITVERNGKPLTPKSVALSAATGIKDGVVSANTATFSPQDVFTASLDGKTVQVYVDECDDGSTRVHLVQDAPNVLPPPEEDDCNRVPMGAFVYRRGAKIVVDVARRTVVDASPQTRTLDLDETGGSIGLNFLGFGTGAWSRLTNVTSGTRGTIQPRFDAATPPYDRSRIDVDDRSSGSAFGGGVQLDLGPRLGARVSLLRESERNTPEESVDGDRGLGGLRFEQQGASDVNALTLLVGPTVRIPGGVSLTGGPSWTRWTARLTQTARLQANCPNACLVVRTDNVTAETKGTDIGWFFGGEYYPGDRWLGAYFSYVRTTFRGVSDPAGPLGYPRDWNDSNLFVGVSVRTLWGRR